MNFSRTLKEKYSPLYFLNAFGAAGLALSFYLYVVWMLRLEYSAIPSADMLFSLLTDDRYLSAATALAGCAGFIFFSYFHVRLLLWNFRSLEVWKTTPPYKAFEKATDKTVLLTIPATLLLSLLLALAAITLFIPYATDIINVLLAAAFVGALYLGWRSLTLYKTFAINLATQALPEDSRGNNLGQMISLLCFSLFSLCFALFSSASSWWILVICGVIASVFFLCLLVLCALFWFVPQVKALTQTKISPESSPLLWFATSVLCTTSLAIYYLDAASATLFNAQGSAALFFFVLAIALSVSGLLATIGKELIATHGFLQRLLGANLYASGLYAVLCPGISVHICCLFCLNAIFVPGGIVEPLGLVYWAINLPLFASLGWLIRLFFRLNAKLFPA